MTHKEECVTSKIFISKIIITEEKDDDDIKIFTKTFPK